MLTTVVRVEVVYRALMKLSNLGPNYPKKKKTVARSSDSRLSRISFVSL